MATEGGAPVKLNPDLPENGSILSYGISPAGRVVYRGDQETDGLLELFSVGVLGGASTKLNGELPPDGRVYDWLISPAGSPPGTRREISPIELCTITTPPGARPKSLRSA